MACCSFFKRGLSDSAVAEKKKQHTHTHTMHGLKNVSGSPAQAERYNLLNGNIDSLCAWKWAIYMALRGSKHASAMLDLAEQADRTMLALAMST